MDTQIINDLITIEQQQARIAALEAQLAEVEREAVKLRRFFAIANKADGALLYAADEIFTHFNADGSLKGEGLWRGQAIHHWLTKMNEAQKRASAELDAIDWSDDTALVDSQGAGDGK